MIVEVYLSDEMLAAGVETMQEAKAKCMTEAEMVKEIYLAMYGEGIRCSNDGEASVH